MTAKVIDVRSLQETYKSVCFGFGTAAQVDKLGKKHHFYMGAHGEWDVKAIAKILHTVIDGSFNLHGYKCDGPIKGYKGFASAQVLPHRCDVVHVPCFGSPTP